MSDRPTLLLEFYHWDCRSPVRHPLLDMEQKAVVSHLELTSNFCRGDTIVHCLKFPKQIIFSLRFRQIYPPCTYVHCRIDLETFTHIQTKIVSYSLRLKPLPATTLPEILFTLKPVIFTILLWILQLEIRFQCFGNTPVCVWENPGCSVTKTFFYRKPFLERNGISVSQFFWNPQCVTTTTIQHISGWLV